MDCWLTDHQTEQHHVLFIPLSTAVGASVLKVTVASSCCLVSFCEKLGSWYVVGGDLYHPPSPPPRTPTLNPHCSGKDWCEKMTEAPVRQSDTKWEVCYAARHNSRRRREGCCPIQTGAQSFSVIYRVTALHSGDLLCKHPIYFSKTAVSGRNHSGWLWEKYKMRNFATAVCDAYQSEAKASVKLSPFLPWNRRRKVTAERRHGFASLSLSYFMSRLLDIPQLDLIKPCSRPVHTFC